MPESTPWSLGIIVLELVRHEVRFVVIGAWAAQAHGVELPDPTQDVDFTPDADPENLDRLSAALHALGARIRVGDVPEGLAFDHSGESLARASVWNLTCEHGDFDLSLQPSGTSGYADLIRSAVTLELDIAGRHVAVPVADLADIVRSKAAAGRLKDLEALPILEAHLRARRPDSGS